MRLKPLKGSDSVVSTTADRRCPEMPSRLEDKMGRGSRPNPCAVRFTWKTDTKGVHTGSMDASTHTPGPTCLPAPSCPWPADGQQQTAPRVNKPLTPCKGPSSRDYANANGSLLTESLYSLAQILMRTSQGWDAETRAECWVTSGYGAQDSTSPDGAVLGGRLCWKGPESEARRPRENPGAGVGPRPLDGGTSPGMRAGRAASERLSPAGSGLSSRARIRPEPQSSHPWCCDLNLPHRLAGALPAERGPEAPGEPGGRSPDDPLVPEAAGIFKADRDKCNRTS
ncbi:hypothetical protein Celaphus_00017554 [Cervus elaphus hippelaphus]|uniref:Uncharacterized protein n=1 Tax=Cervus elaphus hippelaphus TaxID=46360 RepID=A0A212C6K8_CEREH|nr:hypothetical protein Celaphus_00017554 [Cervus elaphus hippelaphus]